MDGFRGSPHLVYFNTQVNQTLFFKHFMYKRLFLCTGTLSKLFKPWFKSYLKSHFMFLKSMYVTGQPRSEPHEILTLFIKLVIH